MWSVSIISAQDMRERQYPEEGHCDPAEWGGQRALTPRWLRSHRYYAIFWKKKEEKFVTGIAPSQGERVVHGAADNWLDVVSSVLTKMFALYKDEGGGICRLDRLEMEIVLDTDGSGTMLLANGLKYRHVEFQELMDRITASRSGNVAGRVLCPTCGLSPCLAVRAGEPDTASLSEGGSHVLSMAESSRSKNPPHMTYNVLKNKCMRELKVCQAVKDYMRRSGREEYPSCMEAWVDTRCCLGMNW